MALLHSRRRSFQRHENLSMPVLPIDRLAEKRVLLQRQLALSWEPASPAPCVRLPSDNRCPRSFGNHIRVLLSTLMSARALRADLHATSAMNCNSMLTFAWTAQLRRTTANAVVRHVDPMRACERLNSAHDSRRCISLPADQHGQTASWCLQQRTDSSALFSLGPHAAYGSVFDAALALPNETVPDWHQGELRISVHARHFDATYTGAESIGTFEAAIRRAAAGSERCAILLASDRRLTLRLMEAVALRAGCRLVQSARGSAVTDFSAEHGVDVGEVVLRDVFLLAHGHVLIGTWGSTLTLAIQELIAARSLGAPFPTVTYCSVQLRRCMPPFPLLTSQSDAWYVTSSAGGTGWHISSAQAIDRGHEWSELESRRRSKSALQTTPATDWLSPASGCSVQLVRQLSRAVICKSGVTFGCHEGTRKMWVRGCRGRFQCASTRNSELSIVQCGFPRMNMKRVINCTCGAETDEAEWPTDSETLDALQSLATTEVRQTWVGAIISGSAQSPRYAAAAASVASCGFRPVHVQASSPDQYRSRADMMLDLFGDRDRRPPTRMSPHELGLLISHKRALRAIAASDSAWGGVFEDDAVLHEAVPGQLASRLLDRAFTTAGDSRVIYLGACDPRCVAETNGSSVTGLPIGLLRGGRCRGYCSHAYAVSRVRAATFFGDVFGCEGGSAAQCGAECEFRPCFMDWALNRYFKTHEAWIVGGGMRSRWNEGHRGLFLQNRSGDNNVSGGTSLRRKFSWTSPRHPAQHSCNTGATASRRSKKPLRRMLVTMKWTGRLGNLLFGWAALVGVAARLRAIAPTNAVALHLPSVPETPALQLFQQLPLSQKHVRVDPENSDAGWWREYGDELRHCSACTLTLAEKRPMAYDDAEIESLKAWVTSPPEGCALGLITLEGYFQSFKYFDAVADDSIRPALAALRPETRRAAQITLASARPSGFGIAWKLVGVQVRLGDKVGNSTYSGLYAQTGWSYYRRAIVHMLRSLGTSTSGGVCTTSMDCTGVAFVITAGGSMGSNSQDVSEAERQLSAAASHVTISHNEDSHVDLAVLMGCDALVIGPSSLGWWAAYLANRPPGYVIAPRHLISPRLPRSHPLRRGFHEGDYYPGSWLLLENDGSSFANSVASPVVRRPRVSRVVKGKPHKGDRLQKTPKMTFWRQFARGLGLAFKMGVVLVVLGCVALRLSKFVG